MVAGQAGPVDPAVGLCSACLYAKKVTSDRSVTFWLCERSHEDERFRKYPPLPVLQCPGFEPMAYD
jgi:hypothetical protein